MAAKSRAPVVVGAGLAAIVGLVVVIAVAMRSDKPSPTMAPAKTPSTQPRSPAALGASAADDKAPPATGPTCAESCKAAARCGIAATTCVADCEGNSVVKVCVDQAITDCNAAAMCTWKAFCQANAPHGRGTCVDALRCQMTNCPPGDVVCGCKCAATLAPSKALHLLRVDACATNCKFDNTCMAGQCKWLGDTCAMQ